MNTVSNERCWCDGLMTPLTLLFPFLTGVVSLSCLGWWDWALLIIKLNPWGAEREETGWLWDGDRWNISLMSDGGEFIFYLEGCGSLGFGRFSWVVTLRVRLGARFTGLGSPYALCVWTRRILVGGWPWGYGIWWVSAVPWGLSLGRTMVCGHGMFLLILWFMMIW